MARSTRGSGRTIAKTDEVGKGRRPDVERELTEKYAVRWSFAHNVATSQFDTERSLHNQARFEAIDKETVDLYHEAVLRGDSFPAVIAYRPSGGKLVIIDGNHRLAAHIKAHAGIDVYEVDEHSDPRVIALMTFGFNTRHGKPTTEAERISQAIYLIDNGASLDKAAAEVNVSPRILRKALTKSQVDKRAAEVGLKLNEWESLGYSHRNRLNAITTDEGFEAAAKLAYAARLDMTELQQLVALVNTTKSGTKQRELIHTQRDDVYAERIQAAAGGVLTSADRRTMGPKARIGMVLGQAMALPEDDGAILAAYAEPEREAAAKRMREAGDRLLRLAGALYPTK